MFSEKEKNKSQQIATKEVFTKFSNRTHKIKMNNGKLVTITQVLYISSEA